MNTSHPKHKVSRKFQSGLFRICHEIQGSIGHLAIRLAFRLIARDDQTILEYGSYEARTAV